MTVSLSPGQADGSLPRFRVAELNGAIANLLERGFAPRFLVEATVSRPQLKKGHLWLTLTDGEASIQAVIWASQRQRLRFIPEEGDGVVVVGKLNVWVARASLSVQVLDIRPSLGAVLRQFERVRALLEPEGLFAAERKRPLPRLPSRVALLTAVPSSALADMLRTARERWPATGLLVVPIPVQGAVEAAIVRAVEEIGCRSDDLGIEALVLARGGGSREDLAVFDGEQLARSLAACPVPVVCGLGHEDDVTIADLIADHRAATPTGALVALLPDQAATLLQLRQGRHHLQQQLQVRLESEHRHLHERSRQLRQVHPRNVLERHRDRLMQQRRLLEALSPAHVLARGFALVHDAQGKLVREVQSLALQAPIQIALANGTIKAKVTAIEPSPAATNWNKPDQQEPKQT